MGLFKYCKLLKDNGNCTKPKPFVEDDCDDIFYVVRKCIHPVNSLELVPTKNKKFKTYRLMNEKV